MVDGRPLSHRFNPLLKSVSGRNSATHAEGEGMDDGPSCPHEVALQAWHVGGHSDESVTCPPVNQLVDSKLGGLYDYGNRSVEIKGLR